MSDPKLTFPEAEESLVTYSPYMHRDYYGAFPAMEEDPTGVYVRYEDALEIIEKLKATIKNLERRIS